jgi:hypothetical protein
VLEQETVSKVWQTNKRSTEKSMKAKRMLGSRVAAACGAVAFSLAFGAQAVDEEDFRLRTTEDLYQLCGVTSKSPNYVPAVYGCRGFLAGVVQYHDAVTDRKNLKRLICYGPEATIEDGRTAFLQWAEVHAKDAQLMQELPVIGAVRGLAAKYPCPE